MEISIFPKLMCKSQHQVKQNSGRICDRNWQINSKVDINVSDQHAVHLKLTQRWQLNCSKKTIENWYAIFFSSIPLPLTQTRSLSFLFFSSVFIFTSTGGPTASHPSSWGRVGPLVSLEPWWWLHRNMTMCNWKWKIYQFIGFKIFSPWKRMFKNMERAALKETELSWNLETLKRDWTVFIQRSLTEHLPQEYEWWTRISSRSSWLLKSRSKSRMWGVSARSTDLY